MEIPNILIVDDESEVLNFLRTFIGQKIDCVIETVDDSRQAIEKIRQNKFDLLLLDIKMPGLSGIDVIKEVVKLSPPTRILAISAYDSREIADQAIKAGAVDYILKSYSAQEIEIKIKNILTQIGKYSPKS